MNPRLLLGGLKSYLPIRASKYKGTGGTTTGRYCYSVWLRHLRLIADHAGVRRPRVVVELGPGDTVGLGLAALLSGTDTYIGLDVLEHASAEANSSVLDELVTLFRARAPIPGEQEFPLLYPRLTSYNFPTELIDEATLGERLAPSYIARLRENLWRSSVHGDPIQYRCPWNAESVDEGSADLVISQVALQDMDHSSKRNVLGENVAAMTRWLRPGGVMSHQIDFSCPGGAEWNHHWAYGDAPWAIIRGHRPYYVNRASLSTYVRLFEDLGCRVVGVEPVFGGGMDRKRVSRRFRDLPAEDFDTRAALVIAVKQ